jgi:hypothetical protein
MAKIWRNRIWAGTQILASCPQKYRAQVIILMQQDLEDGVHSYDDLRRLVVSGNVTPEEYAEITGEDYDG